MKSYNGKTPLGKTSTADTMREKIILMNTGLDRVNAGHHSYNMECSKTIGSRSFNQIGKIGSRYISGFYDLAIAQGANSEDLKAFYNSLGQKVKNKISKRKFEQQFIRFMIKKQMENEP